MHVCMCVHMCFFWLLNFWPPTPPPLTPHPPPPQLADYLWRWICMCVFTCAFSDFWISDPPPPPPPPNPNPPANFVGPTTLSRWICMSAPKLVPIRPHGANLYFANYLFYVNLHVCAKFGPDRTTDGDVDMLGRTHTHTLSYIDIDNNNNNGRNGSFL